MHTGIVRVVNHEAAYMWAVRQEAFKGSREEYVRLQQSDFAKRGLANHYVELNGMFRPAGSESGAGYLSAVMQGAAAEMVKPGDKVSVMLEVRGDTCFVKSVLTPRPA